MCSDIYREVQQKISKAAIKSKHLTAVSLFLLRVFGSSCQSVSTDQTLVGW